MLFASVMAMIFPTALAATQVHPPNIAHRWVLYCKNPTIRFTRMSADVASHIKTLPPSWERLPACLGPG